MDDTKNDRQPQTASSRPPLEYVHAMIDELRSDTEMWADAVERGDINAYGHLKNVVSNSTQIQVYMVNAMHAHALENMKNSVGGQQ